MKHLLPLDRITVLISEWEQENPNRLAYQETVPEIMQWRDAAETRLLNVSDEEEACAALDKLADELEEQHPTSTEAERPLSFGLLEMN